MTAHFSAVCTTLVWLNLTTSGQCGRRTNQYRFVPDGLRDIQYSGTVSRPTLSKGEKLRLAVREYEIFETDEPMADDQLVQPSSWALITPVRGPVRYRLVYAAHLDM